MSESFNPIKGFADELMERRLFRERRILEAVSILKNGEARNPIAVSMRVQTDLQKWAKIILKQALAAKLEADARKPKESERARRIREREIARQEREFRERASFIQGALSLQATLDSPGLHCKAKCKAPNRGYYRPPPPSPTGKGPKIKFIRPERKD